MFYDKEHLKATLDIKSISSFKYNNNKYSAFLAKDKTTLLIKCFDTEITTPYEAWLNTEYNGFYMEDEKNQTSLKNVDIVELNPIDPTTYLTHITDSIIDDEFINSMGIPMFEKDYKKHYNIKRFDYTAWSEENNIYSTIKGVHDVLFNTFEESVNIRCKNPITRKWQNVTGGKNTGAFFKSSNKKCSTLLLCEGLKDGINSDIGFNDVDILVTDGKNQPFLFDAYEVPLEKYKMIFFADDRDVKPKEVVKLFEKMDKDHYEKVKMLDWSLFKEPMKDISNILKAIYEKDTSKFLSEELIKLVGALKTKSQIKRKVLPILKKATRATSFIEIHNKSLFEKLTLQAQHAIKTNNMKMLNYVIKQKNHNGFNLDLESEFLISKPLHSKNEFQLELKKYLSDFAPTIIKKISEKHITLLDSPTNTGKSTLVKTELTKHFKNIIYIAPLRTVVDEFCKYEKKVIQHAHVEEVVTIEGENTLFDREHEVKKNIEHIELYKNGNPFVNVSQKGRKPLEALTDLNAQCIGVTTDVFFNLKERYANEMKQRLSDVDLIVFDEQHLIKESENFREKVTEVSDYLLNHHSGKVLFMSGTPHIDSNKISIVKATVPKENRDDIYFRNNPFENEEEFIKDVNKEVLNHSVMVYCSTTAKVEEVTNLLLANNSNCFSITSNGILWNKEIDKSKSLDPKKQIKKWSETCVYICTTRATTGLNLPNLKGIYQYGTSYNSNTFIQLMARLRSGGFYYYVTPFMERNIFESLEQRVIGICKKFQSLGVDKLSVHLQKEALQAYLVDNLSLSIEKRNLDGFLSVYSEELKIIEAYGLGIATIEKDDYVFNLANKNIDEILKDIDSTIERKYIDRILIDYLCKNNITLLNNIYNLSFTIHDSTIKKNDVELRLITENDKEAKKEKRKESSEINKERKAKVVKKLGDYFSFTQLNKEFNGGELDRLIESNSIDFEKIESTKHSRDKMVILRTALIPIKSIVEITVNSIINNSDIFTVKDLDLKIQEAYPTKKRNKHPYAQFLKGLYSSVYDGKELQLDNILIVQDRVMRNKKRFYDVLRFKKDFDPTKTEEFIKNESERLQKENAKRLSKEYTEKLGYQVTFEQ